METFFRSTPGLMIILLLAAFAGFGIGLLVGRNYLKKK